MSSVDQVEISLPRMRYNEGSAFTATAAFRNRATSASAVPSTAKYRIDCLDTLTVLQGWTSLTPAASISIPITASHNAIQSVSNRRERKQLTVASDPDAADQFRAAALWDVENLWGSP